MNLTETDFSMNFTVKKIYSGVSSEMNVTSLYGNLSFRTDDGPQSISNHLINNSSGSYYNNYNFEDNMENGKESPSVSQNTSFGSQIFNIIGYISMFLILIQCCKPTRPTLDPESRRRRLEQLEKHMEQQRRTVIEDALITKKVVSPPDADGSLLLGDVNESSDEGYNSKSSPRDEVDDDDDLYDESNCCVVCLEPYQVGDVVSWSRNSSLTVTANSSDVRGATSKCLHAFHKDCIVSWLQDISHNDCPSCRDVMIHKKADNSSTITIDSSNSIPSDDDCCKSDQLEQNNLQTNIDEGIFYIVQGQIKQVFHSVGTNTKDTCNSTTSLPNRITSTEQPENYVENSSTEKSQPSPYLFRRVLSDGPGIQSLIRSPITTKICAFTKSFTQSTKHCLMENDVVTNTYEYLENDEEAVEKSEFVSSSPPPPLTTHPVSAPMQYPMSFFGQYTWTKCSTGEDEEADSDKHFVSSNKTKSCNQNEASTESIV